MPYLNRMTPTPLLLMAVLGGTIGLIAILVAGFFLWRGIRTQRQQVCPGGVWTSVISNFGTGMPQTFNIHIHTRDGSPVTGKFQEQKFLWILPLTPREGPLQDTLVLQRDWINALYRVKIFPERDVEVVIE